MNPPGQTAIAYRIGDFTTFRRAMLDRLAEPGVSARIAACLEKNGLPTGTDYSAEALAQAALADKKRSGDSITIVVPKAIGGCELKKVPVTELLPIIAAGLGG